MENTKIAIIGLGYVGLPLAVEFAKKYEVIGFDIHQPRIDGLIKGEDTTLEIETKDLNKVLQDQIGKKGLYLTSDLQELSRSNTYIITVPTPIDANKKPDLTPLYEASKTVGGVLEVGDLVIYESTVYPGATEEECVPILEKVSNLKFEPRIEFILLSIFRLNFSVIPLESLYAKFNIFGSFFKSTPIINPPPNPTCFAILFRKAIACSGYKLPIVEPGKKTVLLFV